MILSDGRELVIGDFFTAKSFNIEMFNGAIDPVIMVDDFRMTAPTFPPHPHAGLSAVTYVFPESDGAHMNYDCLHDPISIEPGDIHWFASGSGAVHTELPRVEGVEVHALQIFVNLPVALKRKSPYATHVSSDQIPVQSDAIGTVRVVSGSYGVLASPLSTPTPFMLLDCHGNEGASRSFVTHSNWNYFLYVVHGRIQLSMPECAPERAFVTLNAGQSSGFSGWDLYDAQNPLLITSTHNSQYVLIGGEALNEVYSLGGPVVMESSEANSERLDAYRRGEFGLIKGYPEK